MPDVLGQQLDTAIAQIKAAGIDEPDVDGGGMFGVVEEANWTVCAQVPDAGGEIVGTPTLTVDRSCGEERTEEPSESIEEPTTTAAAVTTLPDPDSERASAQPYAYSGPAYEVVTVDKGAGLNVLDQYWVYTAPLDYSTDASKDQIRAVITDVAHSSGTDKLIVNVVTDKEIALAEANSTYESFIAEHGYDYVMDVVLKKEATGWIASYSGGVDYEKPELSDSENSFEIIWFGYSDREEFEKWRPSL